MCNYSFYRPSVMTKNRFHLLFIIIAFTPILNVINAKTNINYSVASSSSEIDLSIELWDFVLPITDNNMSVVFPAGTDLDDSCEFAAENYYWDNECLNETNTDGICDELEIFGCIDLDACNYNEFATEADLSCYIVNVELSYVYPEPLTVITNTISPTFTWFFNNVQLSFTESQITSPVNGVYEVLVVDEIGCEESTI